MLCFSVKLFSPDRVSFVRSVGHSCMWFTCSSASVCISLICKTFQYIKSYFKCKNNAAIVKVSVSNNLLLSKHLTPGV